MKKLALMLCLVLVAALLSACGGDKTEAPAATEAAATETAVATDAPAAAETAAATDAPAATETAATDAPAATETAAEPTVAKTGVTITVFNWYDYIDPTAIEMYEKETGNKVNYVCFTNNEEMYSKIEAGATAYDVLFPSDYIVERMIKNDLLYPLDLSVMPNIDNLMESLKKPSYDPEGKYSVVYMTGTLGMLINTDIVKEPVDSWSILFSDEYKGSILMMNSMRDSLGIALRYLGYSMNTRSEEEINQAKDLLVKQKTDGICSGYLLDEIKDKMVGGEAAIGIVYSGDAQYAIDKNDKLTYVVPKEGSNIWCDSMCIPKGSQHPAEAMQFIDFMCRPDIAKLNFEYITYCSPIQEVVDNYSEEQAASAAINPSAETIANCEFFNDVTDCMDLYDTAWMEVRLTR